MGEINNRFIGSGLTFPIVIGNNGRPELKQGMELIKSSLNNIIYWPLKQRFFNDSFGCRVEQVLEEPDDSISHALIRQFIREAIYNWEKRVTIVDIDINNSQPSKVDISLTIRIRGTKMEEVFIFPFYTNIIY